MDFAIPIAHTGKEANELFSKQLYQWQAHLKLSKMLHNKSTEAADILNIAIENTVQNLENNDIIAIEEEMTVSYVFMMGSKASLTNRPNGARTKPLQFEMGLDSGGDL